MNKSKLTTISRFLSLFLIIYISLTSFAPVYAADQYTLNEFYTVTQRTLKLLNVYIDDSYLYDDCDFYYNHKLSDHSKSSLGYDVKSFLQFQLNNAHFWWDQNIMRWYYKLAPSSHSIDYDTDIDSDAFRDAINRGITGRSVSDPSSHSGSHHSVSVDVSSSGINSGSILLKVEKYNNKDRISLYRHTSDYDYFLGRLYSDFNDFDPEWYSWTDGYKNNTDSNFDSLWLYTSNGQYAYFGYVPGTNCIVWNFSDSKLSVNTPYCKFEGFKGIYFCNSSTLSGINSSSVVGGYHALNNDLSNKSYYNIKIRSRGTIYHYDDYNSSTNEYIAHSSGTTYFFPLLDGGSYRAIVGDQLFYDDDGSFYYHNGVVYDLGVIDSPFNFAFQEPGESASENDTYYNFISIDNTVTEIINNYYNTTIINASGNAAPYDDTALLALLRSINKKIDDLSNWIMKNLSSPIENIDNSINIAFENTFNYFFTLNDDQKDQIQLKINEMTEPFNWITDIYSGFSGFLNDIKYHSAVYSTGNGFGSYDDFTLPDLHISSSDNSASGNNVKLNYGSYVPVPLQTDVEILTGGGGIRVSGNSAPKIKVNFADATSDIDYGGEAVVLDFDWYIPYKPTVDKIIVALCWAFFTFKLIHILPGVVRGEVSAINQSKE